MKTSDRIAIDSGEEPYDLYVIIRPKSTPVVYDANGTAIEGAWDRYTLDAVGSGLQISDVRSWSGGIMYLGLPWDEALRYGRALRRAGGGGVLVASTYRVPCISPEEGLIVAAAEFDRLREPGSVYAEGGPCIAADEYCWWQYGLADLTAQQANIIPGVLYVSVHKLTGEIASPEEIAAWIQKHFIE